MRGEGERKNAYDTRDEGRVDLLVHELRPRETLEPGVVLHLLRSVVPESLLRLSLNQLKRKY